MKLTIQDGRDSFYTFDTNRILLLTDTDEDMIKQVEFSTEENGEPVSWTSEVLTGSDGVKYVQVPNEFLNGDYTRLVCYYVALDSNGEYTRQKEIFRIRARQEPQDYFLTYSERVTFASIKALTEQYKATTKQYMDTTEGYKDNAGRSAELASKYAENNEDVAVEPGKYSAKHWSIKAEAAKETAVQKATEAGTSEVNSKTYMESAQSAKQDAEMAKNAANTILEQVQSKGTEITNFVATSKTEIETQKNESVNAVKSVYQTDLNELKGDLDNLTNFEHTPVFNDKYATWFCDSKGIIGRNDAYGLSNAIELPLFVKKVIIKGKENNLINPYLYTAFLYPSTELKFDDSVYGGICSNNGVLELEVPLNSRFLYLSDNNVKSGYGGPGAYDVLFEYSITDDSWYKNIKEELNADTNFIAKINEGCVERINQFDDVVWNQNKVIYFDGRIEDINGYSCTGNIEIRKGDKITITSIDISGNSIARLSKWTSYGTFEKVLELATSVETKIEYTATDDVEYIRLCKHDSEYFNANIIGIKSGKYLERYINDKIKNIPYYEPFVDISMFSNIAVCGDSYTSGALYSNSTTPKGEFESISWGKDLERMSGVSVSVYASGGADVKLYQERWNCLPKILAENPKELYFICLGINDSSSYVDKRGTIEDVKVDYNDNPDTFYGNYGKIIAQIKEHAPKAKVILCKTWLVPGINSQFTGIYNFSSKAIEELANHFDIKYIETKDDVFFTSDFFINSHVNHPIEATYSGMAKRVKYLIEKNIQENYLYYRDYGFTN